MLVGGVFVPVGRVYGATVVWSEETFEKYKKLLEASGVEFKGYYVLFTTLADSVGVSYIRFITSDSPIYIGLSNKFDVDVYHHLIFDCDSSMYYYKPVIEDGALSGFTCSIYDVSTTASTSRFYIGGSYVNNGSTSRPDSSRLIVYSNYDIPEIEWDSSLGLWSRTDDLFFYRKAVTGKDEDDTEESGTSGSSGTSSGSSSSTDTGILTQILSSVGSVVASMEKDSEKSEKYFNALIEEQGNNVGAVVSAIGEAVGSVTASMEKDSEKNEQYYNALIEEQGNNVGTVVSSIEKEGEKTAKYFEALIEEQGKNVGTVVSSIEKEGEKTAKYFEALIEEQGENVGTLISTIEKEGEKTAKYFEEAHPILSGILGGVENIVDVIKDGASKITDGIIGGVKSIFIPEDGYIEKKIKEMQKEFDSMGVVVYDMSVLFGKSSPIEDITVEIKGTRAVIFDSASLEYALDKFRPIIRGFFMLLLVFYNANQYLGFIGQMGVSVSGFVGVVNGARGKGGNNE